MSTARPPAFALCVYCGSRDGDDPRWTTLADQVGHWIGQHGGQLVYGGGSAGLMGRVASATLAAGGTVVGIIPERLVQREVAKRDCTELLVVSTMHERKQRMAERADAFLALPGGLGTMEELFEVWTWRQLGYHRKPIGVLNAGGYYDTLLGFVRQAVQMGFVASEQLELLEVDDDPLALLPRLVQAARRPSVVARLDLI